MIQINDLDLSHLQFDFELTWSVFFLNGDGTVYGRYGTRSENDRKRNVRFDQSQEHLERDGLPEDMSLPGFKESMQSALALHREYEADETGRVKESLRAKVGEPWPWPTPSAMPGIRRACTHCHQVPSNLVLHHRTREHGVPDRLLWSFPMPDLLGLVLDPDRASTVAKVLPKSEAEAAGVRVGDRVRRLDGQPVLSPADVQWVLQHTRAGRPLKLEVERGGEAKRVMLELEVPAGWRRRGSFSWRWRSLRETFTRVLGGEAWHCRDLKSAERAELGLEGEGLAIVVLANMGRRTDRRLEKGDVILGVDGAPGLRNTSEFYAHILQRKAQSSKLLLRVRRGKETMRVEIPVVR